MKTKLLTTIFALSSALCALSQVPQGFNYQAIARDGTGNILQNTDLQVMLYIQSLSTGGTIFWKELHNPVTTNNLGLFSVVVGKGARQTGSAAATFDLIDWKVSPKYLKTEIYYSGSWKDMGEATQLYSVPYAMTARDLAGADKLNIKGSTSDLEEALFEVKNKDSQTIFAVYNEGVRIWVDDGAKGSRGGFAVGGFDQTKGSQEYFRVTGDSTRIYVNNNPAEGQNGGFVVGGFDKTLGLTGSFTSLTPENYFIGHESGQSLTSGRYNSTLGYQSGKKITTGVSNAFLGYQSGFNNNVGSGNLFLGYKTGFSNTDGNYNSFLGYLAGQANTTGIFNTFLGSFSGYSNTEGSNNAFVGDSTGFMNTRGSRNTFVGTGCGLQNVDGADNVFIGNRSGYRNKNGVKNVFIGTNAGLLNTEGHHNVFIGDLSGYSNTSGFSNVILGVEAGYMYTGDQSHYQNTFLGDNAGRNTRISQANVFLGAFCGYNESNLVGESSSNVFIGNRAGYNSPVGNSNVLIGYEAGFSNESSSNNVMIGFESGRSNVDGTGNVYIGSDAGASMQTGFGNTMIGFNSGINSTGGSDNLFIGSSAGMGNANGKRNVVLGSSAGAEGILGDGNVLIGMDAGHEGAGFSNIYIGNGAGSIHGGDMNICLGYAAGVNQKGSGYLIVDVSPTDSTDALLFGNFYQELLRINGKTGIHTHPFDDETDLSIYNPLSCGILAIKGPGNLFNYSQIKLMSQEAELTKYWEIDHRKANSAFALTYHDGLSSWKEHLNLTKDGLLTVGEVPVAGVLLDVRGNAQFRSVGSGAYYAPLNITADGILTTATSDMRLKTNIAAI